VPKRVPAERLTFTRAVAINDREQNRYLLFIPAEQTGNQKFGNNNSLMLAYEYDLDNWYQWDTVNLMGGATVYKNRLFWNSREMTVSEHKRLCRQHNDEELSDYYDHTSATIFKYIGGWDHLGDLSTPKKALWFKVHSLKKNELDYLLGFTLDLKVERDLEPGLILTNTTLSYNTTGRGWGFAWGQAFGAHKEPFARKKLKAGKMRSLRPVFDNAEAGQNVVITGWEVDFATPYRQSMKRINHPL